MPSPRPSILFVAHDTEKSGAPRVTVELARGLAARGWPVRVCFPARGGLEEEARAAGLETRVVANPPVAMAGEGWPRRVGLAVRRALAVVGFARLARRADIVWVGSSVAVVAVLGAWLARRPVVVHVHEDLTATRGNRVRAGLVRRLARAVVFVAPATRPFFGRRPAGRQWALLPNFVDRARLEAVTIAEATRARSALGADREAFVFLTAATLTPRKGIDVLLEGFARVAADLPAARLWIAGGEVAAHAEHAAALRETVRARGLGDRVRFLGHREDLPVLLAAADAFVLASRNEALPLTIAEAMLARRPVVATDVGSVRGMLAGGRCGWLAAPEDAGALADAMRACATDPVARQTRARRACRRAQRLYDREAILDRVEAVAIRAMGR